jgi:hypothetical protein
MTMLQLTRCLLSVKQLLAKKSITEMEHPPYSPDLALNDFWLFPKIKSVQNIEDIQKKNMTMASKAIPQQKKFQKCSQQWQHRYTKCIAAQGAYLER